MGTAGRVEWQRRDTRLVLAIVALALALRLIQAAFGEVVGADGPQFLLTAMEALDGDWATGMKDGIHPVYPLAIIAFGTVLGSMVAGGLAAAAVFGGLSVGPFYAMVRDACGRRVAVVASLFLACLPYFIREHSEVMSDGIFHFFFMSTMALTWFAVTRSSLGLYALSGVVGGVAYLTRPEGVYAPAAAVGLTVLALLMRERPYGRKIAGALIAVAIWFAIALPMLLWIRDVSGHWMISIRGSVKRTTQDLEADASELLVKKYEARSGWGRAFGQAVVQIGRTTFWVVLAFAIFGAFVARGRIVPLAAVFFACLIVGYIGPPIMAASRGHPLSHRYTLLSVAFMLPFAGIAWAWAFDRVASRRGRIALATALGLLLIAGILRGVHPRDEPLRPVHDVARWLREHGAEKATIHASSRLIGVYVGKRPIDLFPHRIPSDDHLEKNFRAKPGEYVVVTDAHVNAQSPRWRELLDAHHRCVATFPSPPDKRYREFTIWVAR